MADRPLSEDEVGHRKAGRRRSPGGGQLAGRRPPPSRRQAIERPAATLLEETAIEGPAAANRGGKRSRGWLPSPRSQAINCASAKLAKAQHPPIQPYRNQR